MKVVALQTWSNGTITMEEKSVQDIPDALAEQLIADGICADAAEYFGGGGGLPDITADDNDTFLMAKNGEWVKEPIPKVEYVYEESKWKCSMTFDELSGMNGQFFTYRRFMTYISQYDYAVTRMQITRLEWTMGGGNVLEWHIYKWTVSNENVCEKIGEWKYTLNPDA